MVQEQQIIVSAPVSRITVPHYREALSPKQALVDTTKQRFADNGIEVVSFDSLYQFDGVIPESSFGATYDVFTQPIFFEFDIRGYKKWQESIGADGDVAAFYTWLAQERPQGWFATLPMSTGVLRELSSPIRDDVSAYYYPCYGRRENRCFFGSACEEFSGSSWFGTAVSFRRVDP